MITPLILGTGRSGQAIAKSFAILSVMRPELEIAPVVWLDRNCSLTDEGRKYGQSILCIAHPHGLHANAIIEAARSDFAAIICEKPAAVDQVQIERLREVKTPTAVLHVYRQTWGVQTLKKMIAEEAFGQVITIEGRYWQASAAGRMLQNKAGAQNMTWKDDPALSGPYDTYLDVGTHWVDAVSFAYGSNPEEIVGWRSYIGANSPHRDSHVQIGIEYSKGRRAFGSISKIFHGATNHFELNIIGSKGTATWNFLRSDEIEIGEGRDRRVVTRKDAAFGSRQPPHHGLGWLEGYVDIISSLIDEVTCGKTSDYPRLQPHLDLLEVMLKASWKESVS